MKHNKETHLKILYHILSVKHLKLIKRLVKITLF